MLDTLYANAGFSTKDATLADVEHALRLAVDLSYKQGGKVVLVLGNAAEYLPRMAEGDKTNRGAFYASEAAFSKLASDCHKYFASVDLYVFGHRRNKNLGSLGEFLRLSGSDLCYYESAEAIERRLTSRPLLQRPHRQPGQAEAVGGGLPRQGLGRLAQDGPGQLHGQHLQRPAAHGADRRVTSAATTPSCTCSSPTTSPSARPTRSWPP